MQPEYSTNCNTKFKHQTVEVKIRFEVCHVNVNLYKVSNIKQKQLASSLRELSSTESLYLKALAVSLRVSLCDDNLVPRLSYVMSGKRGFNPSLTNTAVKRFAHARVFVRAEL